MTTDSDLRNTLLDAVDAEVDVAAFRSRLDRAIADQDSAGGTTGAAVLELHRETTPRIAHRGRRASTAIAIAACVAAIGALVWLVVTPTSRTPTVHHASPTPPGPWVFGSPLFPGSTVLGIVHGTGSQTVPFPVGHATPGRHEHYMALLACSSGPWEFSGGDFGGSGNCAGAAGAAGGGLGRSANSVRVHVHHDTSWRLAIVIEPDARTNAGVQSGSLGAQHAPLHRGNGLVTFPRPDYEGNSGPHELVMTCTGGGFRLSGMNGAVRGDYTHTCFTGFAYTWDFKRLDLPTTLRVHADAGTTWTARLR